MEQSSSSGQTLDAISLKKVYVAGDLLMLGSLVAMTAGGTQNQAEDVLAPIPEECAPCNP